jgi:MFS family permease
LACKKSATKINANHFPWSWRVSCDLRVHEAKRSLRPPPPPPPHPPSPSAEVAYFFLILSLFFFGANHSGIHCAYLDVSPNFSSIMNTIGNTCGAVAGLTGPLMVSALTSSFPGSWGWQLSFLVVFGQCLLTLFMWSLFQTSEIVPALNTPRKQK